MNKKNLEELFSTSEFPDYSIIVIQHLYIPADGTPEESMTKNINACKSLLEASFIPFYLEKSTNKIICYLNYDHSSFSIRTFVGSLRQVLYTIGMKVHSYVFYSEELKTMEDVKTELDFLVNCSNYGFILGRRRPIPGSFLHICHTKADTSGLPKTALAQDRLRSHEFEALSAELGEYGAKFMNPGNESNAFSFGMLFECISEFYFMIKFFFADQNFYHALFDITLADSIIRFDGISGVFTEFSKAIADYSKAFSQTTASEKKHKHIEEMLEYTDRNLATISLSGLSAKFSLTPEYISRLFKTEYDLNFTEYLKRKRFEKAVDLLKTDSKMTISEICEKIGLQSRSYFQNIFKKEYGMSPDIYRKEYNKTKR